MSIVNHLVLAILISAVEIIYLGSNALSFNSKSHRLSIIISVETSPFASAARSDCVRRPIGLRSPSNRIAFAVRSDCVRRPIGLRTGDDDFYKRVAIVRTAFCTGKAHTSFCRLSV